MSYILLIEDDLSSAEIVNRLFTTAGYSVKHCIKGLDGVRMARSEQPACILLDFNLPDIDGRNLILTFKRLFNSGIATPIVALTARTGDMEQKLAARFGCDAFVSKPFEPQS